MLFQRSVTVGIAVGVEREPHFVVRYFFPRMGGRRRRDRRLWFFSGQPGRRKFFPEREIGRRRLTSGVHRLERLQLPLQLPERERQIQLRRDEKRLDEKNGAEKNGDAADEQNKPEPRPAFAGRIGKNEGSYFVGGLVFHSG